MLLADRGRSKRFKHFPSAHGPTRAAGLIILSVCVCPSVVTGHNRIEIFVPKGLEGDLSSMLKGSCCTVSLAKCAVLYLMYRYNIKTSLYLTFVGNTGAANGTNKLLLHASKHDVDPTEIDINQKSCSC